MDASQMVTMKLLRAISQVNNNTNLNNNNSTQVDNPSNPFESILENAFTSLLSNNHSPNCSKNTNNQGLESLDTILGNVNTNKIISNYTQNTVDKTKLDTIDATSGKMENAVKMLENQIGKPYVWGATGPESFDCSGLTQYVYKHALGKDIPRVSADQSEFGKAVDRKDLKVGDLVFFDTMGKGRVSHVGMYVGNNEFIHASNPKSGVKKSTLTGYYVEHFKGARRP